jgi:CRP-like cAMP-binding protein
MHTIEQEDFMEEKELIRTMGRSTLFKDTSEAEIQAILPCLSASVRSFQKQETILLMGKRTDHIGLILRGTAHIERYDYWGNRTILSSLGPGDFFGEAYAASHTRSEVSVLSDEDTEVMFLDLNKLLHMCSSACLYHARLIDNLVAVLAERNLALNRKVSFMTEHTLRDKILNYLSYEARLHSSSSFNIPFNRQELADYLHADRSALSSELSRLQKEGIITFRKNHFTLSDGPLKQ